jgi:hypothetical protein
MQTVPVPRPRVKPTPPVVTALPFDLLVIDITTISRNRPRVDRYFVEKIDCDDLAYSLAKVNPQYHGTDPDNDAYAVNLTTRTCDCKGWHRWGACKHLAAVTEAYEAGRLPS